VLISADLVSSNIVVALLAAVTATVVEALPLEDYDNIALPVSVGLVVQLAMLL
jgi:dolichol kinase